MDDLNYDNMDDDLFGDSVQVALPNINTITTPPPSAKGLAGRLDELSTSGCCSRMAWSKNGCLAYIAPGSKSVNLRVFSRDSSTGEWGLATDKPIDIPPGHNDFPFVHISWSHLGNDLAIVNSAGHVMVFSCAMVLDRMSMATLRLEHGATDQDSDRVIGMHWLAILPHQQRNQIAWAAGKDGEKWRFNIKSHEFRDLHHPVDSKASMIYLKRFGEVRLRFQQPDSSWSEVVEHVDEQISAREAFTHAAFGSNNDNTLLLAAYDVAGRLHLYRIDADWKYTAPKPGQPQPRQYEKPHLRISALAVDDDCSPAMINSTLSAGSEAKAKVSAQLTHLDFLPVTPEKGDGSLPTIQAIFSTPPDIVAVNQSQPQQPPFSIVTRYEVHQVQQNQLHSSLDQVTSKKKSVGSVPARAVWVLKKQTDTMMHSVVLTFSPLWYHMILAFCYSDGTIEFRKRSTMARIDPDYSSEMVTSMTQAGFAFTNVETSLHIALSPNHCMAACMQQDGTIKTRSMEYTYGSLAGDDDEPRQSAALAALVLQSMSAANQYFCSDDIIAVMGELSEARKTQFFSLMFEGLNINIDCCLDEQNSLILLGRAPMFIKTLSAMHVMGLKGRLNRSLTSKTAWAVLNIKYVTQILTTIARMHQQLPDKNLRPEMTPLFINVCRWAMHFMNYLIDELVETGRSLQPLIAQSPNGLTHDLLQQHIHAINKPALLLVLSSFPRVMLKHWFMPIQWTHRTTANVLSGRSQHPPEVRRLYEPLSQAITEAPIKYDHFDDLIKEAQHLVSTIYKRHAGPGPVTPEAQHAQHEQRKLWERDLLLGRIPDALFPAAKRLVTDTIFGAPNDASTTQSQGQNQGPTCLLDKVDMAKIMFFDTTWLGLTASKRANSWFDTHVVDVCQKMIIRGTGAQSHPAPAGPPPTRNRSDSIQSANGAESKKKQLRKCLRCGAYMEDVLMGMPGYGAHHVNWLMGVAKHCICGNAWMLAPEKEGARADGGIFTKARKG